MCGIGLDKRDSLTKASHGPSASLAVTLPPLTGAGKPIENEGDSHDLAPAGIGCHEGEKWREWRGSNP